MKKIFILLVFLMVSASSFTVLSLDKYSSKTKHIEIKGEVNLPSIYEVAQDATVFDVIEIAGGLTINASVESINQNKNLINNEVIVIPKKSETKLISINSASIEELDSLKGIGPSTAQRILDFRVQTPFGKIEDIMQVKGIKEGLFNKIKDQICL